MVKVKSKVGSLSTRSPARCVRKVLLYSTQSLQSPNSVLFSSLVLFLPFSANHVTAQPMGGLGQIEKPSGYRLLHSLNGAKREDRVALKRYSASWASWGGIRGSGAAAAKVQGRSSRGQRSIVDCGYARAFHA